MEIEQSIWIKNIEYEDIWIPCIIESKNQHKENNELIEYEAIDANHNTYSFSLRNQEIETNDTIKLRLNNIDYNTITNLIDLPYVNEPEILQTLRARFLDHHIYTNAGPVLIAINPYYSLSTQTNRILSEEIFIQYVQQIKQQLCLSETNMDTITTQSTQAHSQQQFTVKRFAILIGGESGSGKTECLKKIISYLCNQARDVNPTTPNNSTNQQLFFQKPKLLSKKSYRMSLLGSKSPYNSLNGSSDSSPPHQNQTQTLGIENNNQNKIEQRIHKLQHALLVMESFGNAQLPYSHNSSRCGSFWHLSFDQYGQLLNCFLRIYLVESIRIVSLLYSNERNFHIFYQMIYGNLLNPSNQESIAHWRLDLFPNGISNYLGTSFPINYTTSNNTPQVTPTKTRSTTEFIPDAQNTPDSTQTNNNNNDSHNDNNDNKDNNNIQDQHAYNRLINGLKILNFTTNQIELIQDILIGILHLGEITFETTSEENEHAIIKSSHELQLTVIRNLWRIPQSTIQFSNKMMIDIEDLLITKQIESRDDRVCMKLTTSQAMLTRDALAKGIYRKVLDWIVMKINDSLTCQQEITATNITSTLGLLDIFGFDAFEINSFEQLWINYSNEALQQVFIQQMFTLILRDYEQNHISFDPISYQDNRDTLDLIGQQLFIILDDQCRLPNANDTKFYHTLYKECSKHPKFFASEANKVNRQFGIIHYAGPVLYSTNDIIVKNIDQLPKGFYDFLTSSVDNEIFSSAIIEQPPLSLTKSTSTTFSQSNSLYFSPLKQQSTTTTQTPFNIIKNKTLSKGFGSIYGIKKDSSSSQSMSSITLLSSPHQSTIVKNDVYTLLQDLTENITQIYSIRCMNPFTRKTFPVTSLFKPKKTLSQKASGYGFNSFYGSFPDPNMSPTGHSPVKFTFNSTNSMANASQSLLPHGKDQGFDSQRILNQLRYASIEPILLISKKNYAHQSTYGDFLVKYHMLFHPTSLIIQELIQNIRQLSSQQQQTIQSSPSKQSNNNLKDCFVQLCTLWSQSSIYRHPYLRSYNQILLQTSLFRQECEQILVQDPSSSNNNHHACIQFGTYKMYFHLSIFNELTNLRRFILFSSIQKIQSYYLRVLHLRTIQENPLFAILVIQKIYRGYLCRKQYLQHKQTTQNKQPVLSTMELLFNTEFIIPNNKTKTKEFGRKPPIAYQKSDSSHISEANYFDSDDNNIVIPHHIISNHGISHNNNNQISMHSSISSLSTSSSLSSVISSPLHHHDNHSNPSDSQEVESPIICEYFTESLAGIGFRDDSMDGIHVIIDSDTFPMNDVEKLKQSNSSYFSIIFCGLNEFFCQ